MSRFQTLPVWIKKTKNKKKNKKRESRKSKEKGKKKTKNRKSRTQKVKLDFLKKKSLFSPILNLINLFPFKVNPPHPRLSSKFAPLFINPLICRYYLSVSTVVRNGLLQVSVDQRNLQRIFELNPLLKWQAWVIAIHRPRLEDISSFAYIELLSFVLTPFAQSLNLYCP